MIINDKYQQQECQFVQSCVAHERCVNCASPFVGEQQLLCTACAPGLEVACEQQLGWYRGAVAMLVYLRDKEQSCG